MNIAYAFAVYGINREQNTEYLLAMLEICNASGEKPGIEGIYEGLVREL